MDSAELISLNVGGTVFITTVATLNKDPDSMLAAMFRSADLPPAKKGPFTKYILSHCLTLHIFENETDLARPFPQY